MLHYAPYSTRPLALFRRRTSCKFKNPINITFQDLLHGAGLRLGQKASVAILRCHLQLAVCTIGDFPWRVALPHAASVGGVVAGAVGHGMRAWHDDQGWVNSGEGSESQGESGAACVCVCERQRLGGSVIECDCLRGSVVEREC